MVGVNWNMGCITSTNFSMLVNGTPSIFFTVSGGIRKGFPPSTLLFILVIEGISMLIKDAQKKGKLIKDFYSITYRVNC